MSSKLNLVLFQMSMRLAGRISISFIAFRDYRTSEVFRKWSESGEISLGHTPSKMDSRWCCI